MNRVLGFLPDYSPYQYSKAIEKLEDAGLFALKLLSESLELENAEEEAVKVLVAKYVRDRQKQTEIEYEEHKNSEWLKHIKPIVDFALQLEPSGLKVFQDFYKCLDGEMTGFIKFATFAPYTFDVMKGPMDAKMTTTQKVVIVEFKAPGTFKGLDLRVEAALKKLEASKVDLVLIDLPSLKKGVRNISDC